MRIKQSILVDTVEPVLMANCIEGHLSVKTIKFSVHTNPLV